jgi:hypothetical protein
MADAHHQLRIAARVVMMPNSHPCKLYPSSTVSTHIHTSSPCACNRDIEPVQNDVNYAQLEEQKKSLFASPILYNRDIYFIYMPTLMNADTDSHLRYSVPNPKFEGQRLC